MANMRRRQSSQQNRSPSGNKAFNKGFHHSMFFYNCNDKRIFSASVDASMSEAFEDARSEIDSQIKSPIRVTDSFDNIEVDVKSIKSKNSDLLDEDDLQLPPLETFLSEFPGLDLNPECASLAAELENDLLPSTPLTEDQLRHADSVLQHELTQTGVPMYVLRFKKFLNYICM